MADHNRNILPVTLNKCINSCLLLTFSLFSLLHVVICENDDFYSFSATDIKGNTVSFDQYRGKVSLVVNVASQCGFTDGHYKGLVKLQDQLKADKLFNVLAFPCNQFGHQEPENNDAILSFAQNKYEVNFPMFSKVNVIKENVSPVWKFLIEKSGEEPGWNFYKYLVSHDGQTVTSFGPWMSVEEIVPNVLDAVDEAKMHLQNHNEHQEL